jgi:hypothetical protein
MPKGPQGPKPPADKVADAIRVAKIVTSERSQMSGPQATDDSRAA